MPEPPSPAAASVRPVSTAVPAARTRCPRCAYALTGLPGAPDPQSPYSATTAPLRCPECALEIPAGSHCLVGGASPAVVDPSGSRSVLAVAIGAVVLIGGPWICIVGGTALIEFLRSGTPSRGIRMSTLQGLGVGTLFGLLGLSIAGWFVWRSWRRADPSRAGGDRAGARMRRAMVVPGGVHLWSGEPAADAKPRSLAGGDIRDVRGRRHVPLFRQPGAAEAGAIDLVTPIVVWSMNDAKQASNLSDGRPAGTLWLLMPQGQRAEPIAQAIERTLRADPADVPVPVESKTMGAVPTPTVGGDPNRLAVPVAITAATAPAAPRCPRCSHAYADVPDGPWWEPLPRDVTCGGCGLAIRAGAIVIGGDSRRRAGTRTALKPWAMGAVIGLVVGTVALVALSTFLIGPSSPMLGLFVQVVGVACLPLGIIVVAVWGGRRVPRALARFQDGGETWCFEPGRLRIITRDGPESDVLDVPARGISRVTFAQPFVADNSTPHQLDVLTVRGTAGELGLAGELKLAVPLPAEADQDVVAARALEALRK
jgi:hypothetical protein